MAIIMRIMAMLANIVITLLTDKNLYPTIDIVPPMNPINSPAHGPINISATEPIATPPANVAFWICTYMGFNREVNNYVSIWVWLKE